MRKLTKKSLCAVLTAALLLSGMAIPGKAEAKAKIKISKKKLTLTVGAKKTLKIKGTKKKVKWSSNKKKVATVSKKGVVKAKKKGTAKITAKVGKKKYTCKVTVKAKTVKKPTAKPVVKETATPQTTADSTNSPNNTSNPGGTGTPGYTSNPNNPVNTQNPGGTSNPQNTPEPDRTAPPSEDDGEKTPASISLSVGNHSWNNYHSELGQVTVSAGATVTIGYTGISDGSLDYTNTHGTKIPLSVLQDSESYTPGQPGSFWQNHCSNDSVISLDADATNTIYVRLKDNGTGKVYYLNSDNIVVRTEQPIQTDNPTPTLAPTGGTETPAPTPKPIPTGSSGGSIDLQGKTAFTVGSYQLALGLTKEEVNKVLGNLSLDVKREEKSPQGFDIIAFRPNGNNSEAEYDAKYSTFILIYLKDNAVVGITAIAPQVSYGDAISTEKTAAQLEGIWSPVNWYDTSNNRVGAYTNEVNGANVIGFVDSYGDNNVYCIQVFSNQYSVDDMTDLSKTTLTLNYSDEVTSAMATETGELLNAYLVNYSDKGAMRINTKLCGVAADYSKVIALSGETEAGRVGRSSADLKEALTEANAKPKSSWGEHILIGNMDAVAFANSMIESEQGRDKLHNTDYALAGLGAGVSSDGRFFYPNLVIDYIDFISNM